MDEKSFNALYDEHARRLFNFIIWTTGNRTASEDILQIVFVKIWQSDRTPSPSIERLRWMYTVARNACIDYFRSAASRKSIEFNDEVNHATAPSFDKDDAKTAWKELSGLPETERSILYLHLKAGYSYTEIGVILAMNENAVRVKAFRSLKKLREILIKKDV